MSSIFGMLEKIKARPGLYICRASVSDLFMFVVGYRTAREELGIEPTEAEFDFYGEFQPWLQQRLKITTSSSWAKMIELGCGSEQEAFVRFFELLDEFLLRDDRAVAIAKDPSVELSRAQ
ncbi:hypothetical protein [Myxacorys almedinensis]|uniref:Uncharacterized protein n=1 Tax=Myxacorys almedinensis A TaxID=2690445 RepID=A0A8J7YYQ9_9CYAN|nr:hypothetical protein [Myxacorys almedinensis]NDJ17067.1 hypothetical protein [Myxacorys almedinensis A]